MIANLYYRALQRVKNTISNGLRYRVAAPSIRIVPWAVLASCWPLPQQLLPVSAAWVLGKFPPEDAKAIADRYSDLEAAAKLIMDGKLSLAQSKYNG